jgi:hypothetical protein
MGVLCDPPAVPEYVEIYGQLIVTLSGGVVVTVLLEIAGLGVNSNPSTRTRNVCVNGGFGGISKRGCDGQFCACWLPAGTFW